MKYLVILTVYGQVHTQKNCEHTTKPFISRLYTWFRFLFHFAWLILLTHSSRSHAVHVNQIEWQKSVWVCNASMGWGESDEGVMKLDGFLMLIFCHKCHRHLWMSLTRQAIKVLKKIYIFLRICQFLCLLRTNFFVEMDNSYLIVSHTIFYYYISLLLEFYESTSNISHWLFNILHFNGGASGVVGICGVAPAPDCDV